MDVVDVVDAVEIVDEFGKVSQMSLQFSSVGIHSPGSGVGHAVVTKAVVVSQMGHGSGVGQVCGAKVEEGSHGEQGCVVTSGHVVGA